MPTDKPRALIVDDEPDLCELLALTLARMGVDSTAVHDLAGARAGLSGRQRFALCLTDLRLPDGDGLELVEWIQSHAPDLPVAVITAHGHVEAAVKALKLGAFDFVRKPLDVSDLRKLVNQALKLSQARLVAEGGGRRLLGDSEPMQRLREMIGRVARSQAPVHITGESGTGKELVARLIHESGPRKDAPFVPVNCGAIPSELMESELFGHRKGSFTGAVADKIGLVQAAEGGTLFLDEVADLPFAMQVKLLRLIQEKAARPVGDQREQPVDVRILSATHRDLGELVASGRFREDLYYRINVIELRVPSLRERLVDVPELAGAITERFARRMGITPPAISDAAMELLATHDYPGNVRELENVIERALTLCDGGTILASDVELRGAPSQFEETVPPHHPGTLPKALQDVERQSIVRALEEARYNKTAAARALGISFRALRYRIKKLGIE
ncbi:MAG TPA: sigma-54 dependent transcriptional regulator [Steroidobacteraceae bacterium]|nr:sigma-54 dependent transcriptional regulator [Steroidobacteraceae bacterium]